MRLMSRRPKSPDEGARAHRMAIPSVPFQALEAPRGAPSGFDLLGARPSLLLAQDKAFGGAGSQGEDASHTGLRR